MGSKLSWGSANLDDYRNDPCLPGILKRFNRLIGFVDQGNYTARNMVVSLGQAMFTPRGPGPRTTLDPNDRPYAGWLYLAFGLQLAHRYGDAHLRIGPGHRRPPVLRQTDAGLHPRLAQTSRSGRAGANQLPNETGSAAHL